MNERGVLEVPAADGGAVAAELFVPGAGAGARGAVLVVPAMGVSQSYYAPFAAWLARQGFLAATFDYRGTGRSLRGRVRDVRVDIAGWGRVDCAAMIDALAERAPGRPLYWVGHSLGGQILPFVPNLGRVTKAVTVAAGSGYWRENSPRLRRWVWLLWYVLAPAAVRLCGYFPGKRLGVVGDLPRGVIEQWRRWCLDPDYAAGAEGPEVRSLYQSVRTPLLSLSFTDDEFMSARNVESLHALFAGAPRTMIRLAPRDVGERRVGHFGFFRPRFEAALWRPFLLPALS
jgi:predicted alpha/beta hydrolase